MKLFDPAWLRLHHRVCDRYEAIAFRRHAEDPERVIDVVSICAETLEKEIRIPPQEADKLAKQLHADFQEFSVRSAVEGSLRSKNPDIPDEGVSEIYKEIKKKFLGAEHWHAFFLSFVISFILTLRDYGITRGDYLIRIALDTVPEEKGFGKILKRTFRFASFMKAEDKS